MIHNAEPVPLRARTRLESINTSDSGGEGRIAYAEQLNTYLKLLRAERVQESKQSFVIFGQGRSGSSLLVDLLNCVPGVHCDGEILGRRVALPLRWVSAQRAEHPTQHYGFKVKIYQLTDTQRVSPARLLEQLHGQGWQLVYLRRANVVRQIVSNFVLARDRRSQYVGADAPSREPVWVNPDTVLHGIEGRATLWESERAALGDMPFHEITYEDDLEDASAHQATLDRLTRFLDLPRATARTQRVRINVAPLREIVQNYDELTAVLKGTRWEHLLL